MMKRLVVLLLLAGAAYFGYQKFSAAAPAKTFARFAEAWARGRTDEAMTFAEGGSVKKVLEQKNFVQVICAPWQVDAWHGFSTSVNSSSTNAEGDLDLDVEQSIAFDPPGATSGIGGAAVGKFHHVATLKKTPDGWKVIAFKPECVSVTLVRGNH
jgi:hypothetical protein